MIGPLFHLAQICYASRSLVVLPGRISVYAPRIHPPFRKQLGEQLYKKLEPVPLTETDQCP